MSSYRAAPSTPLSTVRVPRNHHSSLRGSQPQLGSSPSQSSLVYHSLPAHGVDRSHLLALQSQYTSPIPNPQLEELYSRHSTQPSSLAHEFAPLRNAASSDFSPPPSPPRQSAKLPHFAPQRSEPPADTDRDASSPRIDPTPLLTADLSLSDSSLSPALLAAAADPHKPVRRWLYDFSPALNTFFWRCDNAVTQWVQAPLRTVGGLTTSLEEEILESNEMALNQSRRYGADRRDANGVGGGGDGGGGTTVNGSGSGSSDSRLAVSRSSMVLQRSLAITRCNKAMVTLALIYTALTTIEIGVCATLFLFLVGLDTLATMCLFTTLCVALGSQLFKRFVWRARPWMAGRAIQVKRDLTSSFPSRAVTCAVVYAYVVAHCFYPPHAVPVQAFLPPVLLFAVGAGVARIFVGAHYFSDCLFGFILGCAFTTIGSLLNRAVESVCAACYKPSPIGACYGATDAQRLTADTLGDLNGLTLLAVSGVSVALAGLAMSSPLHFWKKNIPIFGLLAPCLAFRLVLLCPGHNGAGVALAAARDPDAALVIAALLISAAALLFAKAVNRVAVVQSTATLSDDAGLNDDAEADDADPAAAARAHSDRVHRLFMQFSGLKILMWNLVVFLFVFAVIFIALAAWRIEYAPE